jgi:D-alanyl-D-alanine carboxypeptidase
MKPRHIGLVKLTAYCVAICAIFPLTARGADDQPSSFSPAVQTALEAAVTKNLAAYGGQESVPGAVVGIWAPGKGTFVKGIGLADLSTQKPMDPRDKFRIGSNTKTFVVMVLLQLVDEKKLSLDDKLSQFDLGVSVPNAENITIRQLCNMTSGLFEVYHAPQLDQMQITPRTKFDPRELVALAVKNPPDFPPGKGWYYSNTGYLLLGLIIEAVSHNSVENEIRDRLLVPLGLRNTSFPVDDPGMPAPFSHGYALDKDGKWQDSTVVLPPSLTWAAGVMISDMEDMKTWVKAYVTGSTNSMSTQKERLGCVSTGKEGLRFGLGVGCTGGWFGYTGGIPEYNTAAYYLPSADATIIALVNSQRETPEPGVANSIFRDLTRIIFPANVAYAGMTTPQ